MKYRTRIRNAGLAAMVGWNGSQSGFTRTAAYFTGIPSRNSTAVTTKLIIEAGIGVIQPQYYGTYDSEGELTPDNCVNTIFDVDTLSRQESLADLNRGFTFKVGVGIDVLIGHCAGSCFVLDAIIRGLQPRIAILLSPMCEFGVKRYDAGIQCDFESYVEYIANAFPLTHRMKPNVWRNFFLYEKEFHPLPSQSSQRDIVTQVIAVAGERDPVMNVKQCEIFTRNFISRYSYAMSLREFIVVPNASHSEESLLCPKTMHVLEHYLNRQ